VDADLPHVQKLIDERFEGIVLESAVQGWVYLDKYERGLAAYKAIKKPTPKDQRWAGVCHLMLHQRIEAQEVLYRAVARGEEAARIELARVLDFMDRSEEATIELNRIDVAKLGAADRVLLLRAQSLQQEYAGNFGKAIELAESGWRQVQGLPEYPVLVPWLLIRLGLLYSQAGRVQRALWCFERASEIVGEAPPYLRLARLDALVSLGHYAEAVREAEALKGASEAPAYESLRLLLRAEAAWATGDVQGAVGWFSQAVPKAVEAAGDVEFLAHLALAALYSYKGVYPTALEHLARARVLVNYRRDHLDYRFREVLLDYWRGALPVSGTQQALATLAEEYGAMGLLQEQGQVQLHLAELFRAAGGTRYLDELDKVQAICAAVQNQAFLAREWVLLPQLREAVRISHPKLVGSAPKVLEVYSMGDERIMLAGQTVNIRLRRAVEILAYFLEHQEVGLKKLMADIFPDDKPKSARLYFHQFRNELNERLPGVRITHHAETRTYRLESDYDILWDVAELRAGRKMGDLGIFLPGSGSEWAHLLNEALEPLREAAAEPVDVKRTRH
jgi:tetratricopeptide (TPR) repeat protein